MSRNRRLMFAIALAVPLLILVVDLARPSATNHEPEIRNISGLVQRIVPTGDPIHVLQTRSAKTSVYPTATLFYCRRKTHIAHGVEDLLQIARRARNRFVLLTHRSTLAAIQAALMVDKSSESFRIVNEGDSGELVLLTIVPPVENNRREPPVPITWAGERDVNRSSETRK